MERQPARHKAVMLFLCVCVLWTAGCFTKKRPAPHLGPVAFAHPEIPTAMLPATMDEPPELETEVVEPPPKLTTPRGGPARPRVVLKQPAEPRETEKVPDPVIVPDLTLIPDQVNAARTETQHSLDVAERNLAQTQGKKLNEAQQDVASKVRGFLETARDAEKNEDWLRARNLAKKAEVLSSELTKDQ